jgi:predicted RNase H-like nuclease (RuvC/YqgF family)
MSHAQARRESPNVETLQRPGNAAALRRGRAEASAAARSKVEAAVKAMLAESEPISFAGVARRAGTSRSFVYGNAELRALVDAAKATQVARGVPAQRGPESGGHAVSSLRADLAAANQQITRLKAEVAKLKKGRRANLGAQVEAMDLTEASNLLAQKTHEVDRLATEVQKQRREIETLQRLNAELTEDLAAERRAAIALADQGAVRPLTRKR